MIVAIILFFLFLLASLVSIIVAEKEENDAKTILARDKDKTS